MDTNLIEKEGINPLKGWLAAVDIFGTPQANARLLAKLTNSGFFGMYVDQDLKKSDTYTLYIGQGGIGLPDRDYYFRKDGKSEETRKKYKEYIQKIFELQGQTPADAAKNAATSAGTSGATSAATPLTVPVAQVAPSNTMEEFASILSGKQASNKKQTKK
jgi:predicted metalloendopeptidase